jgi:hypothetical protein
MAQQTIKRKTPGKVANRRKERAGLPIAFSFRREAIALARTAITAPAYSAGRCG